MVSKAGARHHMWPFCKRFRFGRVPNLGVKGGGQIQDRGANFREMKIMAGSLFQRGKGGSEKESWKVEFYVKTTKIKQKGKNFCKSSLFGFFYEP
jgi:hypothetical protein